MKRFTSTLLATLSTTLSATFLIFGLIHPVMAGPTIEQTVLPAIDLTPLTDEALEQDSSAYRGLNMPTAEPRSGPQSQSLMDRTGLDPEIDASATGLGASQRIDVGGQHLPETQTTLQPYLELGANAERRENTALLARNGLDADVSAQIGGGANVSVNEQIDLRLGYTREEPLGSASITGDAEEKVETGVRIKF